jgi:hypothetical protein
MGRYRLGIYGMPGLCCGSTCGLALPGEGIPLEECLSLLEPNSRVFRPGRRCGGPIADLEAEGAERDAPLKDQYVS